MGQAQCVCDSGYSGQLCDIGKLCSFTQQTIIIMTLFEYTLCFQWLLARASPYGTSIACSAARSSAGARSRCPGWSVEADAGQIRASAVAAPEYDADATVLSVTMAVPSHKMWKRQLNAAVESVCSHRQMEDVGKKNRVHLYLCTMEHNICEVV